MTYPIEHPVSTQQCCTEGSLPCLDRALGRSVVFGRGGGKNRFEKVGIQTQSTSYFDFDNVHPTSPMGVGTSKK